METMRYGQDLYTSWREAVRFSHRLSLVYEKKKHVKDNSKSSNLSNRRNEVLFTIKIEKPVWE